MATNLLCLGRFGRGAAAQRMSARRAPRGGVGNWGRPGRSRLEKNVIILPNSELREESYLILGIPMTRTELVQNSSNLISSPELDRIRSDSPPLAMVTSWSNSSWR